ncbi:competence type IV pilus minor pilin ComGF [Holzapfeliella sp. JNUCC 80]
MRFKGFTLIEAVVSLAIVVLSLQLILQISGLNQRVNQNPSNDQTDYAYFYLKIRDTLNEYDRVEIDKSKSQDKQIYLTTQKNNQTSRLSLVIKENTVILRNNNEGYVPVLTEVRRANFCYNIERGFSIDVEDSKKRKSQLLFILKS